MKPTRLVITLRMQHLSEKYKTHGKRVNYYSARLFLAELERVELVSNQAAVSAWLN